MSNKILSIGNDFNKYDICNDKINSKISNKSKDEIKMKNQNTKKENIDLKNKINNQNYKIYMKLLIITYLFSQIFSSNNKCSIKLNFSKITLKIKEQEVKLYFVNQTVISRVFITQIK